MIGLWLRWALLACLVKVTTQTVYKAFDDTDRDYNTAGWVCQMLGGKLAMPKTQSEQEAIMAVIEASGHDAKYWIGLKRDSPEDQFVWADNEELSGWTNWNSSPSDDASRNCVRFVKQTNGNRWVNVRCNLNSDYICEFESNPFPESYDIDVYVLADRQALDIFRTDILRNTDISPGVARYPMAEYLAEKMDGIKGSFEAIGINLNIIGVKVLLEDPMTSTNAEVALSQLGGWLRDGNVFEQVHYDISILFTGQDISGSTVGLAGQGTVCYSSSATGFVKFDNFRMEELTIHEMGHMLGAEHDTGVMRAVVGSDRSFTTFSKNQIFTVLDFVYGGLYSSWMFNCLQHTPEPRGDDPNANLSDDEKTPDVLCNNAFEGSHFCRTPSQYENGEAFGDSVCSSLKCTLGWTNECEPLENAAQYTDGMVCAQGKKCQGGLCLDNPDASNANIDNSCLAGDAAFYMSSSTLDNFATYTCGDLVENYGNSVCKFWREMESNCCSTCNQLQFSEPDQSGCEYEDGQYPYGGHVYSCPTVAGLGWWCNEPAGRLLCCQACGGY